MDLECLPKTEEKVLTKEPPPPGPEGECCVESSTSEKLEKDKIKLDDPSTKEAASSDQNEKLKESKIQTLKRFVAGKAKSKNEQTKEKQNPSNKKEERSHSSRELRNSLSRVFSVSSSGISRVWSSLSATRIHAEGEPKQNKTLGRSFGWRARPGDNEDKPQPPESANKTLTLGRRFSTTFRSAFGRSKES